MLRSMDSNHLDRQAVEPLFGVGERRARQLMVGLPSIRVGAASSISLTPGELHIEFRAVSDLVPKLVELS